MQKHMALIAFFVTTLSAGSLSLAADDDSMTEQQNMQSSQPAMGMQTEQQQDAAKQEPAADQRDISPNGSQRAMSKQLREHPKTEVAPAADPESN